MAKNIRYSFDVSSNVHIQNFLGNNNSTNHSFFWLEEHDNGTREFRFASSLLSNCQTPNEILSVAEQLTAVFQGIYTLLDRGRNTTAYFKLGDIYDHDNKIAIRKPKNIEIDKIDLEFSSVVSTPENAPVNPVYILFEKICTEPFLLHLFFLLSKKTDYKLLYMIYDHIRYLLKNQGDNEFLKPYKNHLNNFTHTANNYHALGYGARHGSTSNQPPAAPMSLADSKDLIFDIIGSLLAAKFGITLPEYYGLHYNP